VSRAREDYVGEWLPEPLLTSPNVAEDVELAESVSIAMLTVLETLGPVERAVFVLREVFEVPYEEIAEATGKSAAAVRQVARRAREHVAARRPRMRVSRVVGRDTLHRGPRPASSSRLDDRTMPAMPASPPFRLALPRLRHRRCAGDARTMRHSGNLITTIPHPRWRDRCEDENAERGTEILCL
jgi:hypothetical protein